MFEFYLGLVGAEHFSTICTILALVLAWFAVKEWQAVAFVLALEFLAGKVAYVIGYDWFIANGVYPGYLTYAIINSIALGYVVYHKSHFAIATLLFISMCYNIVTAWAYFKPEFIYIYYAHSVTIGTIMLLELGYLVFLNSYVSRYMRRMDNSVDYINTLFRCRHILYGKGLV